MAQTPQQTPPEPFKFPIPERHGPLPDQPVSWTWTWSKGPNNTWLARGDHFLWDRADLPNEGELITISARDGSTTQRRVIAIALDQLGQRPLLQV